MRWRLVLAFLGVVTVMLLAQDIPLVGHLRDVERDRQLTDLERDAFIVAGQAATASAATSTPNPGSGSAKHSPIRSRATLTTTGRSSWWMATGWS